MYLRENSALLRYSVAAKRANKTSAKVCAKEDFQDIKPKMFDRYGCELLLFRNVTNAKELHEMLMSQEQSQSMQFALIKPALILDPLQVALAIYKAQNSSKLTTRSVFTEILYNLGPTKNIASSLRTFGLSGDETEILVAIIDKTNKDFISQLVLDLISGERVDLSTLSLYTDFQQIIKVHKLNFKPEQVSEIKDIVLSRIASKDVS